MNNDIHLSFLKKKTDDELFLLNKRYLRKGNKPTAENYYIAHILSRRHGSFYVPDFSKLEFYLEERKMSTLYFNLVGHGFLPKLDKYLEMKSEKSPY